MKPVFLSILLACTALFLNGQETVVSGTVKDAETGDVLIGATVQFVGTSYGVNTNFDGTYRLKSKNATDSISVQYLGYKKFSAPIQINKKQIINASKCRFPQTQEQSMGSMHRVKCCVDLS